MLSAPDVPAPDFPAARGLPPGAAPRVPSGVALLRALMPACRAKARLDLFQACAMLSDNPDRAAHAYAEALVRTLGQGLGRAPVLHRPGTPELSFDEAWLAALFDARARGDDDSFVFLTRRRLTRPSARQIGWLVARVAGSLGTGSI